MILERYVEDVFQKEHKMNRHERLMATLRGDVVDRPAVSFYEIGAKKHDPDDPDKFNVYNGPTWRALIELAEEQTDVIRLTAPKYTPATNNPHDEFFKEKKWTEGKSKFTRITLTIAGRTMTQLCRRDAEIDTIWTIEHLLKDIDDINIYLQLPDEIWNYDVDVPPLLEAEEKLGDAGIVGFDTPDPLCMAAELFSMADYMVFALTEQKLFHQLIEKMAFLIHPLTEQVAREFPGRLWRVFGSEYAAAPYLPPHLYEEYFIHYTEPMVRMIQKHGGYARIHSHGKLRGILPHLQKMAPDALDPVEPPDQGDMELIEVREQCGKDIVLMGNIEISDIETLGTKAFEKKVEQALRAGTAGQGRGFVLLPSSSPYGREITPQTMKNYETMVRMTQSWGG